MKVTTYLLSHKILLKNQEKFYTFITKNMKLLKFIYFNNFISFSSETYKFSLIFKDNFVIKNLLLPSFYIVLTSMKATKKPN